MIYLLSGYGTEIESFQVDSSFFFTLRSLRLCANSKSIGVLNSFT